MSHTKAELEEMLVYLDKLRESAETNMMGAASYLQLRFGLDKHEARDVLFSWMDTYDKRHPED